MKQRKCLVPKTCLKVESLGIHKRGEVRMCLEWKHGIFSGFGYSVQK